MKLTKDFESEEFVQEFHYDGPLGAFCGAEGTLFRLWAPTANMVSLRLYDHGNDTVSLECIPMERKTRGVWELTFSQNLDGYYYTYDVTVNGITKTTGDPYARSCGVNGERSQVIDLDRTDPVGWSDDHAPARTTENIIYEVHVGDFSSSEDSGICEEYRGKYLGLASVGSTVNNDGVHATGLDYLKELGITHIELMPVYDFGSIDEKKPDGVFNWGYDPVNYNIPEGSYATDPYEGEKRIRELKQAILAMHRNGFRVIMDVVYNHTYNLESPLNRTVPGYYYRQESSGIHSNGSGCGNDIASERSMCGKYILDSVLYWAEEYHIDGFRFDLMGLLPVELMLKIRQTLDERFGKEEKILFGEPWAAGNTAVADGAKLADKSNLHILAPHIGAFCDTTRDAVKGSLFSDDARGFVNGGGISKELLIGCLRGWAGHEYETPSQTISYLSSHDDWTLWDRLVNTLTNDRNYHCCDSDVLRANRLAIAILTACQGSLFLLSGEEFGRTKHGVKNSYNSSLDINQISWSRMVENRELVEYYKGLFALRKQLLCLCDKRKDSLCSVTMAANDCAVAQWNDENEKANWKSILFVINASADDCQVALPEGKWQILADGTNSFQWKNNNEVTENISIPPVSAMFLGR